MQENPYQATYQGSVIFKMFGEDKKKMREFHEDYKENTGSYGHNQRPPTAKEEKIADEFKLGVKASRLIRDYELRDHSHFNSIISNVWKHRNK